MIARLKRLLRHALFRPQLALLLFGSLTVVSNWFWFGTGLFVGRGIGLAVWLASLLAAAVAALALVKRRHQLPALCLLIAAAVVLPTLALVAFRWKTGAPILMHDGAYQTEEAIKLLLAGRDPYGVDYGQTSMGLWHWYVNQPLDPSLFHYVYYPLTFLVSLPGYALSRWLGLPFDYRLTLVAVESLALLAILRLPWRWEWRYVCLAALFLNPFFYMPQGRNDVLFLAGIALAALYWSRGQPVPAAWGFGLSLALKQFALPFVPPVVIGLLTLHRRQQLSVRGLLVSLAGLAVPAAATILPFLAWDARAFWTDTVGVVTGTAQPSFPIRGLGLSGLMVALHLLPSRDSYFPFGLVQAAVATLLLGLGARRVWRQPSAGRILQLGATTAIAVLLCSRYLNDSHLATLLFLLVLAGAACRGSRPAMPRVLP